MASSSTKRKSYSVKEKIDIIEKVKQGISKAQIKREFGIPEGTIRGWMSEEAKLRSFLDKIDESPGLERKKTRLCKNSDIDKCLYTWFVQKRNAGVPLSGLMLKMQAEKFFKDMNMEGDFKATEGWLWRWQKRHGIGQITIQGELKSNDNESAKLFPKELKAVIDKEGYCHEQLYNCDETALYYRMLPNKSLDSKSAPQKAGMKLSKNRVTLLFCVNKTGSHKLLPLCIGKSKNPRCFKNVNLDHLAFQYKATKNAWMTANLFLQWFHESFVPSVRAHLIERKLEPKALLILDNCPAHPPADSLVSKDGKIKVMYLPKNTTAIIQPLDQGIIHAFKVNFRRELLQTLISSDMEVAEFLKKVTLKDVSYKVGLAWNAIKPDTISNCWKKCLTVTNESNEDNSMDTELLNDDPVMYDAEMNIQNLQAMLGEPELTNGVINQWVDFDNNEPICLELNDDSIIAQVIGDDGEDIPDSDEEQNEEGSVEDIPTAEEALQGLETVMSWLEGQRDLDSVQLKLLQLASVKNIILKHNSRTKKQKKITDFFKV